MEKPVTRDLALEMFKRNIKRFPHLEKYVSQSLMQRFQTEQWYENRVIRYVLRKDAWSFVNNEWEREFRESKLDQVKRSVLIFDNLHGTSLDYDEQLFDALAEVKLAYWARLQGYHYIEKLETKQDRRTPEFLMRKGGLVSLAEAKHYRERDYLPSFVAEHLEGLALLKTQLVKVDLRVTTTKKYASERDDVLSHRGYWISRARQELDEDWFEALLQEPVGSVNQAPEILNGLIAVKLEHGSGRVTPSWGGFLDHDATASDFLERLKCDLTLKLNQIKKFEDNEKVNATHAVVFFSGIDDWSMEWYQLWMELSSQKDASSWLWARVRKIKEEADELTDMSFELIVGRGNPVKYQAFPWDPSQV